MPQKEEDQICPKIYFGYCPFIIGRDLEEMNIQSLC